MMPADTYALLVQFEAMFPLPQGVPGEEHEDRCRQWAVRFAEQAKFSFPTRRYGVKRATENRPISKDSLADNRPGGLVSWDLMLGAGTGRPTLPENPQEHSVPDQIFVEVVAFDHLGGATPEPGPEPPIPAPQPPPQAAQPAHPYEAHVPLSKRLGEAFCDGYGETHVPADVVAGITEAVGHLLWRYQFEKATAAELLADARVRGVAARG